MASTTRRGPPSRAPVADRARHHMRPRWHRSRWPRAPRPSDQSFASSAIGRASVRRRPKVRATWRRGVEVTAVAIEAREVARDALESAPHRFSIVRVSDVFTRRHHAQIRRDRAEAAEVTSNQRVAAVGLRELVAQFVARRAIVQARQFHHDAASAVIPAAGRTVGRRAIVTRDARYAPELPVRAAAQLLDART